MTAQVKQDSFEPGAKVLLRVDLTEYDVPVAQRAKVEAAITSPSGNQFGIGMSEVSPGAFEEVLVADEEGVWTVLFRARGTTFRKSEFTREQVRTVAVWEGGDRYEPREEEEPRHPRQPKRREAWQLLLRDPDLRSELNTRLNAAGLSLADLEPVDA